MDNEEILNKETLANSVQQNNSEEQGSTEAKPKKHKSNELKKEIEELNNKLSDAENKMQEYLFSAQRLQADFDNYRKRNLEIYKTSKNEGIAETVKNILPVLDNLKRAELIEKSEGVTQIIKQFNDILKKMGIIEIPAKKSDLFNADFHYAVMQDDSGEFEQGTITDILQEGYMFENGKIIRFSMVKVAI